MPRRSVFAAVWVSTLAACAPTIEGASDPQGRPAALGVLQIEREAGVTSSESTSPDRSVLGAAFARYRGLDERDVARLLGVDLHRTPEACTLIEPGFDALESPEAEVELLDVGTLEVTLGSERARLVARTFPELARVAAGFFYAGEASLGAPTPEVDEYLFHTDGSPDVAPMDVAVLAPTELSDVRVDGTVPASSVFIDRRSPLVVSWTRGDERDVIELELRTLSGTLSCTSHDDGLLRVEANELSQLGASSAASFVIRRVRVQPFAVAGVDEAVARLSSVRSYDLTVR